jgi:EamA domain-containing membrane protein RarD
MKILLAALGMITALSMAAPAQAVAASKRPCLAIELGVQNYIEKALDMVYAQDTDRTVLMISENVRKIEILEFNVIKVSGDFYSVTYQMRQTCDAGIDVVNKKIERIKPNYGGGLG